jgi:murein DD-endopeptidase MepM/ murein hydrolase activator NlpD
VSELDTLPEELDLTGLDSDDQLETIVLSQPTQSPFRGLADVDSFSLDDEPIAEPSLAGPREGAQTDAGDGDNDDPFVLRVTPKEESLLLGKASGPWLGAEPGPGEETGPGEPEGKERGRRDWLVIVGIVIAIGLLILAVIANLEPPKEDALAPVAVAPSATPAPAPAPEASPVIETAPDLAQGTLARESDWRDSLVIDSYEVPSGGTLSQALERLSLAPEQRRSFYQLLENKELLGQVMPGENFTAWWSSSDRMPEDLERVEYLAVGALRPLIFLPGGPDGFYLVDQGSPPKLINQAAEGTVSSTFWEAGEKAGLEPWVIMKLVDLLASQIDFVSDIMAGDSFQILFLGEYQDGSLVSRPIIETIRFTNQDNRYEFYRHVGKNGEEGYFDAQFRSIKKTFFKSPLQYSRISSGFTKNRMHPILKVVRPHLGVDYAAPTGTPVSAVADGVVNYAGFRGGYGRLVILEHEGDIVTMYGHLSVITKGMSLGAKVKQGDVIGNVGSTGLATGPHLDFRIRRKGEFVDPEKVLDETQGQPMPQEERMDFADKLTRDQEQLRQLLEVN